MAEEFGTSIDVDLLEAAFSIAARVHARQLRKGSTSPYLAHLFGVTELVWMYGGNDVEAAAALLHDAVEDGGGEVKAVEIEQRCGQDVADIVRGCSDSRVDTTAGAAKEKWWDRKTSYVQHFRTGVPSASTQLVSACDKLHNLSNTRCDYENVGDDLWRRFKEGWESQVWYYRSLLKVYEELGDERVQRVAQRIRTELESLEVALRFRGHDLATVPATAA
jgi:(p)ppGpp synthase/HD superfamily hydrolase